MPLCAFAGWRPRAPASIAARVGLASRASASVPPFFVYQLCDASTDSFASIGKQHGTKPGFYLLVGPHWSAEVPPGITATFRSSTDICVIIARVFQDDTPED